LELEPAWLACLEEAWAAYAAGSVPIGAAYADAAGRVLLRGRNRHGETCAPRPLVAGSRVAHAEINVLVQVPSDAHPRMAEGALYTSMEPCPMCFGAAVMNGVREIRFGARDGWAGAANLTGASPYLGSKGMRIFGPEPRIEAVSLVLATDYWLREASPRSEDVVRACEALNPPAVGLGRAWFAAGHLQQAVHRGASVQDVADEILGLVPPSARL